MEDDDLIDIVSALQPTSLERSQKMWNFMVQNSHKLSEKQLKQAYETYQEFFNIDRKTVTEQHLAKLIDRLILEKRAKEAK